jgi:tetratricopeptide (TPR) repeat protein
VWLFLAFYVFSTFLYAQSNGDISQEIEMNSQKLAYYFIGNKERIIDKEVISLANKIIHKKNQYTPLELAKTYVLLSDIALNQENMTDVLTFAQEGLSLVVEDKLIILDLLFKMVLANYNKGKFEALKRVVEKMLLQANDEQYIGYRLKALAYRSVYYALVVDHALAQKDLQLIEKIVNHQKNFIEDIELLEIMAIAYFYLNNLDETISFQLHILNLRFQHTSMNKIEHDYNLLASAYLRLGKLDDAYNLFWEARKSAKSTNSTIKLAYAELGLGQVLYAQKSYQQANTHLLEALTIFKVKALNSAHLNVLIVLTKSSVALDDLVSAERYLTDAELLLENIELTFQQFEVYQLLAQMYYQKKEIDKAWQWSNHYLVLTKEYYEKFSHTFAVAISQDKISQQNRKKALELTLRSDISGLYADKISKSASKNTALTTAVFILIIIILVLLLRHRTRKLRTAYKESEQQFDTLPSSTETKHLYQKAYKMARKYHYKISVGYIVLHNWNELFFYCNKKEIEDIKRSIATVINEYKGEFDQAGLLNDGEYLLIFPHQNYDQVDDLMKALTETLQLRFFANLGEVSVTINYSIDTLSNQSIDPFLFLLDLTAKNKKLVVKSI